MKLSSKSYGLKQLIGLLLLNIIICTTAVAQEYKYEIGGMAGMSNYLGDANQTSIFQGMHPSIGAVFRKNVNFRWAMKANLLMGKVSGDTHNTDNVFPGNAQTAFSRNFYELGGQMEFNFLPYSDKFPYLNTSKISPYLLAGLGFTLAPGGEQSFFGVNLPLGIGVKYKIKNRVNLGVEYSIRKLFNDGFDSPNKTGFNLDNPYKIPTSFSKNNDWYSFLMISLTWDFGPNDRPCTNLE